MHRGRRGRRDAQPRRASAWAPAGSATVHPGVMTFTDGAQCTSNFVFTDGSTVYLGQAAHCSGTGAATDTNGCTSKSLPIGTPVDVTGASRPGTAGLQLVDHDAGQRRRPNANACAYNDLALVKINPADVPKVNPSVPGFGGPTGVGTVGGLGSTVYSYGNSELRGGVTKLSPKQGVIVQNEGNGWSHNAYTVTPGIPGDSGSGFMNASGHAIGVLSTVELAPRPSGRTTSATSARRSPTCTRTARSPARTSCAGTKPFNPSLVEAIQGS